MILRMQGAVGGVILAVLAALGSGAPGLAQESTNVVATMTDWSVFEDPPICGNEKEGEKCRQPTEKPTDCWGVSAPKETVNTRDGAPVSVQRGDILFFVTFRPGKAGEISFTGGYPFAPGSAVQVNVDGTEYALITDGDWGWPASVDDEANLLAALKKGQQAVMTAKSGKGTQTRDTFSLRGFTAAMEEAAARCK